MNSFSTSRLLFGQISEEMLNVSGVISLIIRWGHCISVCECGFVQLRLVFYVLISIDFRSSLLTEAMQTKVNNKCCIGNGSSRQAHLYHLFCFIFHHFTYYNCNEIIIYVRYFCVIVEYQHLWLLLLTLLAFFVVVILESQNLWIVSLSFLYAFKAIHSKYHTPHNIIMFDHQDRSRKSGGFFIGGMCKLNCARNRSRSPWFISFCFSLSLVGLLVHTKPLISI